MASLLNNVNKYEIMKWLVILPIFTISFLNVGKTSITQLIHFSPNYSSLDYNGQSLSSQSDTDWSLFVEVCEVFENELEEEDENQFYSEGLSINSFIASSYTAQNNSSYTKVNPYTRNTKLFILFHSWKSFLFI